MSYWSTTVFLFIFFLHAHTSSAFQEPLPPYQFSIPELNQLRLEAELKINAGLTKDALGAYQKLQKKCWEYNLDSVAIDPTNNKKFTVYCNDNYIKAEAVVGSIELYARFNYNKQSVLDKYSLSQLKDPALAKDTITMNALHVAADEFAQPEFGNPSLEKYNWLS